MFRSLYDVEILLQPTLSALQESLVEALIVINHTGIIGIDVGGNVTE